METLRAGRALAVLLTGLAALDARVVAQHWPQWRGPSSQGLSSASGLPTTWSREENLAWSAPLAGVGTSSPIVWGDLVIATSQAGGSPRVGRGAHPQLADDKSLAARGAAHRAGAGDQ